MIVLRGRPATELTEIAKQHANSHILDAPQWPEREQERDEQTVERGNAETLRRHLKTSPDGQKIAVELIDQRRHGDAECETDGYTNGAHQQDLNEENAEDLRAGGADAAQRGNDLHALVDERRNGIRDADATDQERCKSDENEELPEPLERPRDLRRGIVAVGTGEAGGRQLLGISLAQRRKRIAIFRQPVAQLDCVTPTDQRAGFDKRRPIQRCERRENTRAIGQTIGDRVRLDFQGTVHSQSRLRRCAGCRRPSDRGVRAASNRQ